MAHPEGPTPTPRIEYAAVCNNHSEPVNGLHLRLSGVNYANVLTNAPGCDYPTVDLLGYVIMNASWSDSCVDPGETVIVGIADCSGSACGVPSITCYDWSIDGQPDPSPCDRCPTDTGDVLTSDFCETATGDLNCDEYTDGRDVLALLGFFADLSLPHQPPCPQVGSGTHFVFGDLDCDGSLAMPDVLRYLRFLALARLPLNEGCRAIGG